MTPHDELVSSVETVDLTPEIMADVSECAYEMVRSYDAVSPDQIPEGISMSTCIALVVLPYESETHTFVLMCTPTITYRNPTSGCTTFRTLLLRNRCLDEEQPLRPSLYIHPTHEIQIEYNAVKQTALVDALRVSKNGLFSGYFDLPIKGLWLFRGRSVM